MKIHCIKHEPFEGLASIEDWIRFNKHELSVTYTYMNQVLPATSKFDMLIILGGTASLYTSINDPWLIDEKHFIEKCIRKNKLILGICLGSQIIAEVLGAKVYVAREKEIGWFPVRFNLKEIEYMHFMPKQLNTFHWHSDTFKLPTGAVRIGSSYCTENQGFIYDKNIIALQFHPEVTQLNLSNLVKGYGLEIEEKGRYIQGLTEIMAKQELIEANTGYIFQLLDYFVQERLN